LVPLVPLVSAGETIVMNTCYDNDITDMIDNIFKERVSYIFKKKKRQRDEGEWVATPFQVSAYFKAVLDKAKIEKKKMVDTYLTL